MFFISTQLSLGGSVPCEDGGGQALEGVASCIHVPTLPPTSCGVHPAQEVRLISRAQPYAGIELVFRGGVICPPTRQPRQTTVRIRCDRSRKRDSPTDMELTASEGTGSDICKYVVEVTSAFGCPTGLATSGHVPLALNGVEGCRNDPDSPLTRDCRPGSKLVLFGKGFRPDASYAVTLHPSGIVCQEVQTIDLISLSCTLPTNLPAGIAEPQSLRLLQTRDGQSASAMLADAVTFRQPTPSFSAAIFRNLGVGGLDQEITELYRRVFQVSVKTSTPKTFFLIKNK